MIRISVITSFIVIVLMGTGCVLTNPTDPYEPVKKTVGNASSSGQTEQRDPSGSLPDTLTLDQAIETALENNPGVAAAKTDVAAAEAQTDRASSRRWPDVSAGTTYTSRINEQPLGSIGAGGANQRLTDDVVTADLSTRMPLFTSGQVTNQIRAATLQEKAAVQTLSRTRRELTFNVSRVFFSILAQQRVIESVKMSRKALQEHLAQVENLISSQKATKVDRLRTQVRLANVEEQLTRARNVLEVKRYTLAKLLGMRDTPQQLEVDGELRLQEKTLGSLEEMLAEAYKRRADYQAAERKLEARARQVDIARAELWPTVSLEAGYAEHWDASRFGNPEETGQVGLAVRVPLFQGGENRAEIRQKKAELAAAQDRLRQLKLQVRLEVRTARSDISSARKRVTSTEKAVDQGKESLRIERTKYRLGEGTQTDVLDAQAELLEAQTNYYRALADYNTALKELRLAMGAEAGQE